MEYNWFMYSWSTDEVKMKKKYPEKYEGWKLVQNINHGSDNIKINKSQLVDLWPTIFQELDIYKRRLLEYLIWGNQYSLPTKVNFWS